jgi:hypothetical protein
MAFNDDDDDDDDEDDDDDDDDDDDNDDDGKNPIKHESEFGIISVTQLPPGLSIID